MQTAPQIRLVQGNDTLMVEKIQSTIVNTIPLWKSQMVLGVEPGDTPESLQKRVMQNAEWILLPQAVSDFCAGRLSVNGAIFTSQE